MMRWKSPGSCGEKAAPKAKTEPADCLETSIMLLSRPRFPMFSTVN